MNINKLIQTSLRLLLILSLSTLTACDAQENAKPAHMTGGSLVGVNYTGEGIQYFSVDEAGGGAVGRYGISGDVCCAMYPKKWTPELKVTVKWKRTDCEGRRQLCTLDTARAGTTPMKFLEKTIPMEKYTELGEVYVVFLPHDDVRLYISTVGPRSKKFPSKLGIPNDPDENNRTKSAEPNNQTDDPTAYRRER